MLQHTAPATDLQRLAAPLLATRREDYADALAAYYLASSAQHAHTRQQVIGFRLAALNAALDALGLEPEPAPQLLSLDALLATDFSQPHPLYHFAA